MLLDGIEELGLIDGGAMLELGQLGVGASVDVELELVDGGVGVGVQVEVEDEVDVVVGVGVEVEVVEDVVVDEVLVLLVLGGAGGVDESLPPPLPPPLPPSLPPRSKTAT